ncbi:ATP-binding cassette domain-containing protein [Cellulomonas sp. NPDC089187]|uniref:ABC-F family ATP-binding cassette domain-containing protein n=1 Tax=Cellulomonas sp. NPDC089187 TaxID=3154970 RepID=UPI003445C48F
MGHLDVNGVGFVLPDGRPLLHEVHLRVGEGHRVALIGPNGAGKSTLLRIITGELIPHTGTVTQSGGLGVMRQDVGRIADDRSVRDLLAELTPGAVGAAALELSAAELAMMETDDEPAQMRYAQALADWADVGGYEVESDWDRVTDAVLSIPFDRAQHRTVRTLSGGEQKRLVLEALLRGPQEVLLLDEPDNALDVPTKRWLEQRLIESEKTVLLVSHDRELLSRVPTAIATLEPRPTGAGIWVHGGRFDTYAQARTDRMARQEELLRRWEEERTQLKELVLMYKQKAAYNSDMASRYQSAQTRLRRFEEAGPPEQLAREQHVRVRLRGGRTAKRAVVAEQLELTGLMRPFDLEVWFGERVAVLGSNGSGKSHFLRLLAAGGTDPGPEQQPVDSLPIDPVRHSGTVRLGSRVVPGFFAQNRQHAQDAEFRDRTLLEILHAGDGRRQGMGREAASRALDRYELVASAEQRYGTLSGGQQARFHILLLELGGATLLLLDEPTDNLDLHSAEALEAGLEAFEGTVLAVTHDRWFARGFDRFLVFGEDGAVVETPEPVWDAGRVVRAR